jgi:integrase
VAAEARSVALSGLVNSQQLYLRDGEVVLYRRRYSLQYQCRYKLADGTWCRRSTAKASLELAAHAACELYDEARFRQRLGLAHRAQSVAHLAELTARELRRQMDLGHGKSVYGSYLSCIERYFIPFFTHQHLESLTHSDITEFELWRNKQMQKWPKASTLQNFASAWNKVIATAVEHGYISERVPVPRMQVKGIKSQPRAAFTESEIAQLRSYMATWVEGSSKANKSTESDMRHLLRDYIEMLLFTGMRHGTEALGVRWKDVCWHTQDGKRYLRIWVNGKTGGRWLIAKHAALGVLERLHARHVALNSQLLEKTLQGEGNNKVKKAANHLVFTFSNGYQPTSLNGAFKRLMRDSGLLKDADGHNRTLYSLRHSYATLELLRASTDIHTLSKQMGNSAAVIERHYSKLTATMAAERLA